MPAAGDIKPADLRDAVRVETNILGVDMKQFAAKLSER